MLAQDAGRVLTHEDLLRRVWAGRGHAAKSNPRSCAPTSSGCATSSATRPPARPWIVNERGVGYRMPRPGEAVASPDRRSRPVEPTSVSRV